MTGTTRTDGPAEAPTSRRKAPVDTNRIPGSAASMHVQERTQRSSASSDPSAASSSASASKPSAASSKGRSAIAVMQPFLDSSTTGDSPIEPTDIQLLTTSILSNQERQRVILFYQEKLIHSNPTLLELRQSLLFLSAASWGQILEERNLARKCSYPPCPHASPTAALGGRGKFRIDMKSKSVRALEDRDLGEPGNTFDEVRDLFCARACYARSEWILRWVLSDKELGLREEGSKGEKGGAAVLGGKWQKLTAHPRGYEQIELLEDLEAQHAIDLEHPDPASTLEQVDHESEPARDAKRDPIRTRGTDTEQLDKAMGGLNIIERGKSSDAPVRAVATASQADANAVVAAVSVAAGGAGGKTVPSRTAYTVDVPNTVGARFSSQTTGASGRDEGDEDEVDVRERELERILRFASLATGSRPRPRNTTIRIETSAPTTTPATEETTHDPPEDPQLVAQRREIARMMDEALAVRNHQREKGLLD